jgi:hypothetical protein
MADTYPPPIPPPPGVPSMQPPGTVPPPPPSGPPPAAPAQPLPWEQPGYPFLEAVYETAKLILTAPSQAFARMSLTGDIARPLLYAVIFGWIGVIANQAYSIALRGAMMGWLSNLPGYNPRLMFGLPVAFSVVAMVIAPVLILIVVFVGALIVHLFLLIVGGANTGFSSTLKVMCYATTVQVFQVVPICGGMVGGIWALVLEIIGLAVAHRTTQGKSALGVLGCPLTCCVCGALAIIMAVILGFTANLQHIGDALRHLAGQ